MKKILLCFVILSGCFLCHAHPGIGIVKDSKGNIYYTDLAQVWKIDPATGKRSIVVRNVHTHELSMDNKDNLYGEHLWYNGEAANTWGHYVWRLQSNGVLDTIVRPTAGFLENYSFVRDSLGNMYWAQRFKPVSRIMKSAPDGKVITIAEGKFRNIRWMHVTPGGTVYFVDLTDLYKIENEKLSMIAANLQQPATQVAYTDQQHDVYGIWQDEQENVYLAILGGQIVKKVTPAGEVEDVVYSPGSWLPSGGVFDNEENMWLMEINIDNEVRVRKIEKETLTKGPAVLSITSGETGFFAWLTAALLVITILGLLALNRVKKRKTQKALLLNSFRQKAGCRS